MPGLSPATASAWVDTLESACLVLLCSWAVFLALPAAAARVRAVSYTLGALLYTWFSTLTLAYNPSHSMQAASLFVLGASLAVPHLHWRESRAAPWLRCFLLSKILCPVTLCSFLSRVRYAGMATLLSALVALVLYIPKGFALTRAETVSMARASIKMRIVGLGI